MCSEPGPDTGYDSIGDFSQAGSLSRHPGKLDRDNRLPFGGPHFDVLYATDGVQVFRRRLKLADLAPWAAQVSFPSQGGS